MSGRYVVMGVSGCGKSTVGAGLAKGLSGTFIDGDDLHPPGNIAKMSAGQPLDDDDRAPWLEAVGAMLGQGAGVRVIACSALKRAYRDRIRAGAGSDVIFVYLEGSQAVLIERMGQRTGHFMPTKLLDSQLATLEVPDADEAAVTLDIDQPPDRLIAAAVAAVRRRDMSDPNPLA